ncbi:hypothetical protein WN48_00906 [Eufriesea mexicana]|uniref:Uncharacterized protein n=1 Tax=Eufriesea mexicana TaxID=516756 RepID=A0A310SE42_9HYME|nr:hypothetical protein WN48_00906 [Eufriesea mexicana]
MQQAISQIIIDESYIKQYCRETSIGLICERTRPMRHDYHKGCQSSKDYKECGTAVFKIDDITLIPMHTPNKYIAIPKDSPAIISSNEECVLLYNNNAMKIGGTSKNVEISTSNYTLHINFTEDEIHLLQSYIPHVLKVTPNFKDFRHSLENMNTKLNDIKTHKGILTATEIVYDLLKIVGWISLGSITFYTLHKIGFLSFISKILPKAICFKICCNELRISNDSESKTYATPPSAPLPALPEDSNAYLLEELPVSRSKKIVRFGGPKATLRRGCDQPLRFYPHSLALLPETINLLHSYLTP